MSRGTTGAAAGSLPSLSPLLLLQLLLPVFFLLDRGSGLVPSSRPRSIRLESVIGSSTALDVVVTAPEIVPPGGGSGADLASAVPSPSADGAPSVLLPTLYNLSYGFKLRQRKTQIHRMHFTQMSTATLYTGHSPDGAALPGPLDESNQSSANAFVRVVRDGTELAERPLCAQDDVWKCPSGYRTPCRVVVGPRGSAAGRVYRVRAAGASDYSNALYRLVVWFSFGDPEKPRSADRSDWQFRYSSSLARGAVVQLNEHHVKSFPGPRWHTSPMLIEASRVRAGWNKLEIFGADTCCNDGGHTLEVRFKLKTETDWTKAIWEVWGEATSDYASPHHAVSGFMPPIPEYRSNNLWNKKPKMFAVQYHSGIHTSWSRVVSKSVPLDATDDELQRALVDLNTTGLVEVTRLDTVAEHGLSDGGAQKRCEYTGWCSWEITFMTNVLFQTEISEPDILIYGLTPNGPWGGHLEPHESFVGDGKGSGESWPCDGHFVVEKPKGAAGKVKGACASTKKGEPEQLCQLNEPDCLGEDCTDNGVKIVDGVASSTDNCMCHGEYSIGNYCGSVRSLSVPGFFLRAGFFFFFF